MKYEPISVMRVDQVIIIPHSKPFHIPTQYTINTPLHIQSMFTILILTAPPPLSFSSSDRDDCIVKRCLRRGRQAGGPSLAGQCMHRGKRGTHANCFGISNRKRSQKHRQVVVGPRC